MEQEPTGQRLPTRVVAERVRELRKRHGWSAERLAGEMKAVGIPWERMVVTKLETNRRSSVTLEELLALAYVLDVAPVHLLVPVNGDEPYEPIPGLPVRLDLARKWIRGQHPIGDVDLRIYGSEVPAEEFQADDQGRINSAVGEAQMAERLREVGVEMRTKRDDVTGATVHTFERHDDAG